MKTFSHVYVLFGDYLYSHVLDQIGGEARNQVLNQVEVHIWKHGLRSIRSPSGNHVWNYFVNQITAQFRREIDENI